MEASVATVCSMCEQLDADLIPLRERNETAGLVRDYLIRRRVGELDFLEVRFVVLDMNKVGSWPLSDPTHNTANSDNGSFFSNIS